MPSLTRANLVTRVGLLIDDPANQRFTAAQVQDELNKAQEQFVLDTECLKDVASTITVVDGTAEYSLPTDILRVFRVAHKGLKLESISKYELDLLYDSDWSDDEGTPKRYYVDLDPDNKKIHLYPIPQSGDAGANLIIEYLKFPAAMTSDSDTPFGAHTLLAPYNDAVAYYAARNLLIINPSQETLLKASAFEKEYRNLVTECINKFRSMGEQRPMNLYRGRNPYGIGT